MGPRRACENSRTGYAIFFVFVGVWCGVYFWGGGAWVLFGLADNVDHTGANVTILHSFQNTDQVIESDPSFWDEHGSDVGTWRTAENKSAPILLPHADLDLPFAVFLGDGLAAGEHTIVVEIVEQGDPWENTRTYTWTFSVNPPAASAE